MFIAAWRVGRCYGRVLRLRKRRHFEDALTVARDGITRVLISGAKATPPVLTSMLGLGDLARALAQELGRPDAVNTELGRIIDYWEHAIREDPSFADFQPFKNYIASFRTHLSARGK